MVVKAGPGWKGVFRDSDLADFLQITPEVLKGLVCLPECVFLRLPSLISLESRRELDDILSLLASYRPILRDVVHVLEKELATSLVASELSMEEYCAFVVDRVLGREENQDIDLDLNIHGLDDGIEDFIGMLVGMLQYPDFGESQSGLPHNEIYAFEIAIKEVVERRRTFVRDLFYMLCLRQVVSGRLFRKLQALVCCYYRLSMLLDLNIERGEMGVFAAGSLVSSLVNDIGWEGDNGSECRAGAIGCFIGKLGWARVHPLGSIKEAAPVLNLLGSIFDLVSPAAILDILETLPTTTAAGCVMRGRCFLARKEEEEAKQMFLKAAGGEREDIESVVPGGTKLDVYYGWVMDLCVVNDSNLLAIYFGRLARIVGTEVLSC